jgi:hypothetical protein
MKNLLISKGDLILHYQDSYSPLMAIALNFTPFPWLNVVHPRRRPEQSEGSRD